MATEQTQQLMTRYFDLMGSAADFGECYAPDVTWLVADTGRVIRGPEPVRDYVVALHETLVDARTRRFVVGEDHVCLEGDCAALAPEAGDRTHYCVAYDVRGDLIIAMRCYGLGARVPGR